MRGGGEGEKRGGRRQTGKSLIFMVPRAGVEPARGQASRDFKSLASTSSATQATHFSIHEPVCLVKDERALYLGLPLFRLG